MVLKRWKIQADDLRVAQKIGAIVVTTDEPKFPISVWARSSGTALSRQDKARCMKIATAVSLVPDMIELLARCKDGMDTGDAIEELFNNIGI